MKKIVRILLIVALCLILVGGVVFAIGFGAGGCKWAILGSTKIEQKHFAESAENILSRVEIDYENADVEITFDETATSVAIDYPQLQDKKGKNLSKVTVTETPQTVTIVEKVDAWILGNWDLTAPKVKVVLPAERLFSVFIVTDNGDIAVSGNGKATDMSLTTSNGDVKAKQATVVCEGRLEMKTDNGDIYSFKTFEARSFYADADNGDVCVYGGAANDKIELSSDNGDVEMSSGVLKAAEISVETDNGDVELAILDGEKIYLETDNGDVTATLIGKQTDYSTSVSVDLGDSNIGNLTGGAKSLTVETDLGDIKIYFTE
ncbi:MAG: DUF4097 family beta strand repeat protein [Clostridia bacterium]|nr:DUF4097 family beta strand repeat protein [Clostridia bacterium]